MNPLNPDIFFTFFIIIIFVTSLILYKLFIYFSHSFGVREYQKIENNRWNPNYKPSVGGFVFYIVFLFTMIFGTLIFGISPSEKIKILGFWGSASIAFFMGFADDTFNTQPVVKSVAQISCALLLILTGTQIHLFENNLLNHFITIFWVIGIMNSINMLDNMDGIAGSSTLYILSFIALIMYQLNTNIFALDFLIFTGLCVSLIAFLLFNFYPSTIFMGDTGSQFLGLILSYAGIEYIWNLPKMNNDFYFNLYTLVVVALVYLILLIDTTTVTINRLLAGGSPFVGGKDHTTHFLWKRVKSERKVFYIFSFIQLASLFIAYQLIFTYSSKWLYIGILYSLICFLFLYLNTKIFVSEKD